MVPVTMNKYDRLTIVLVYLQISGALCFSELFFITEPRDVTVVYRAPVVYQTPLVYRSTVVSQTAVVLDCQADGEAPIQVRWLWNGVKLEENERFQRLPNGSLYMAEAMRSRGDKSNEGFYQCLAQNKHGAILSRKARLTIATMSAFVSQPTSIVVTQGSVGRLSCRITATPPPIITWEFNRVPLPLVTERITTLPGGVLQIYAVRPEDAGYYRCIATSTADHIRHISTSLEATLAVTLASRPPPAQRPHIIAGPQSTAVALHQTAVLECLATGNPQYSWSRVDGGSMDVHNAKVLGRGNLVITDVQAQHAGVYLCRAATPDTPNFVQALANITVLVPPSLMVEPKSLLLPHLSMAWFPCQAAGVPAPHITWLKNGEEVHYDKRLKMLDSDLVINDVIPEDEAMYQCQAENVLGSVLSMNQLKVMRLEDEPSAPRNLKAEAVSRSSIRLCWDRPLINSDKVYSFSIYMKKEGQNYLAQPVVVDNAETCYLIDRLEPAQKYTFYIVASTRRGGTGPQSDSVVQQTLRDDTLHVPGPRRTFDSNLLHINNAGARPVMRPQDQAGPPRNLQAEAVSSSAIQLSWDHPLINSDKVIGFSVHYVKGDGLKYLEHQVVVYNTTTRHLVDHLEPAQSYTFYIVAYTRKGGTGPKSDSVVQQTLRDVPLRALDLSNIQVSKVLYGPPPDVLQWAAGSSGPASSVRTAHRTPEDPTAKVWGEVDLTMDETVKVYKDDTVQFHCRYNFHVKPSMLIIQWLVKDPWSGQRSRIFYGDNDLQEVDRNTEFSERIQVTSDQQSSVLTLRDVRLSDERLFVCLVDGMDAGCTEGSTHLRVIEPRDPPKLDRDCTTTADGSELIIDCLGPGKSNQATFDPPPAPVPLVPPKLDRDPPSAPVPLVPPKLDRDCTITADGGDLIMECLEPGKSNP